MRAFDPLTLTLAAALAWTSPAHSSSSADSAAVADTSLAASTAPPWNPAAPVGASQTWETVVRTPGIILSLPLVGLGWAAKSGLSYVESHNMVPYWDKVIHLRGKVGVSVLPAAFGDRVGFAAGLRFQPPWFSWLDARIAGSTGQYNAASVAFGPRALSVQYQSAWRPKDQFFGVGLDADQSDVSTYASQSQSAGLMAEKIWESQSSHRPLFHVAGWVGERDIVLLDGRDPIKPGIAEVHPVLASQLLGVHVEHLIYGGLGAFDHTNGSPHWSRGYRLSARVDRYDKPIEGLVLHGEKAMGDQFLRITYEGQGGISFWRDPRTIRLGIKVVDQTIGSNGSIFILPDLAKLGGQEGLVGFEPGRFQSTDAAVAKLSYIFPLGRYLEIDAHTEAGGVYSQLQDLRASTLKQSYGTTVRIRNAERLLGGFGLNWSAESLRFGFQIGGNE